MKESETRLYSEYELIELIDELTEAAFEAIEQAAAEAARAATLASIEREMAALQEAQKWRNEAAVLKRSKIRTAVIAGVICFISGFTTGSILFGVKK